MLSNSPSISLWCDTIEAIHKIENFEVAFALFGGVCAPKWMRSELPKERKLEHEFYWFALLRINHIHTVWRPCLQRLLHETYCRVPCVFGLMHMLRTVCEVPMKKRVARFKRFHPKMLWLYRNSVQWLSVWPLAYRPITQSIYTCSRFCLLLLL